MGVCFKERLVCLSVFIIGLNAQLSIAGIIEGYVYDQDNVPVKGAKVELRPHPKEQRQITLRATTNPIGFYRLRVSNTHQLQLWGWAYLEGKYLPLYPTNTYVHATPRGGKEVTTKKNFRVFRGRYRIVSLPSIQNSQAGTQGLFYRDSTFVNFSGNNREQQVANGGRLLDRVSFVHAVNSEGQMVGHYEQSPVLLPTEQESQRLTMPPGHNEGQATGVSDSTRIVGYTYSNSDEQFGVYWRVANAQPMILNGMFNAHFLNWRHHYQVAPKAIVDHATDRRKAWVVGQADRRAFRIEISGQPLLQMLGPAIGESRANTVLPDGTAAGYVGEDAVVFRGNRILNLGLLGVATEILKLDVRGYGLGTEESEQLSFARQWTPYNRGGLSIRLNDLVRSADLRFDLAFDINHAGAILCRGWEFGSSAFYLLVPPEGYRW